MHLVYCTRTATVRTRTPQHSLKCARMGASESLTECMCVCEHFICAYRARTHSFLKKTRLAVRHYRRRRRVALCIYRLVAQARVPVPVRVEKIYLLIEKYLIIGVRAQHSTQRSGSVSCSISLAPNTRRVASCGDRKRLRQTRSHVCENSQNSPSRPTPPPARCASESRARARQRSTLPALFARVLRLMRWADERE